MPFERSKSHGKYNNEKNNKEPRNPQKCLHQHNKHQAFAAYLIRILVNTL